MKKARASDKESRGRRRRFHTTEKKQSKRPAEQGGFELSPNFWEHFVERNWEKCPLLLKQPFATPLAGAADVFRGVTNAARQYCADGAQGALGFFVDHALLQAEIEKYLPTGADATLGAYAARVATRLNGGGFALMAGRYLTFDAQTWLRLRDFLRPLYELIGIPANPTQVVMFLGNYNKTPFGVHRDPHETFVNGNSGVRRTKKPAGAKSDTVRLYQSSEHNSSAQLIQFR